MGVLAGGGLPHVLGHHVIGKFERASRYRTSDAAERRTRIRAADPAFYAQLDKLTTPDASLLAGDAP